MTRLTELYRRLEIYSPRACIEGEDAHFLYAELLAEIPRWEARLDEMDIRAASVVALRAEYSLSAIAALLAIFSRAAVAALIPRHRPVAECASDSFSCAIIDIGADGTYKYDLVSRPRISHPLLERMHMSPEAGFIVFTSGTSGRPKAALHSLERFLSKLEHPGRSLRTLAFLLFDHIAGVDTVFYTLWNGGTLILTHERDPQSVMRTIGSHQVEVLPVSPTFLRLLCATQWQGTETLSSVRVITYGSEPMDQTTLRRVNERFPHAQILQKYGSSELGSPRTASRANNDLWVRIKGGLETKVLDGVLWVRGEGTMLGYLNAASPVLEDGWYCTGDLVEVEGEWIRFLGRADETIKVGGEKVVPAEVERVIREIDFVRDVLVLGEPHPIMGQVAVARLVVSSSTLSPGELAARIRQHCRARLGPHHVPVRIDFVSGPLSCPGTRYKLQRRSITN